ncbi:type IVB secretion system protein IcmH/DotU [Oxalobacteraceae bacterium OTU3CINTB1]|nr:type IVB secretion system protein IcmH/DotU [Oxalobacteraceae bacterium OTU3CINTB1]
MSAQDPRDPNPDPDATMMVPRPGGRRPASTATTATAPVETTAVTPIAATPQPAAPSFAAVSPPSPSAATVPVSLGGGLNPLVRAANPLLDLVVPLRTTAQPPDLQQLRERLAQALKTFEVEARAGGVDSEAMAAARYALCTLLDETIASTAWGSGVWNTRSLLVAFHNEASGGEKVFLILQRLSQNPAANLDLLELMYLCLALGLEGRYRMLEQGQAQLATLRERLLQLIRQHRGSYEADLSPSWRGETMRATSPLRRVPLWVLVAAAAVVLLIVQLVCGVLLNRASDPVFAELSAIRVLRTTPAPPRAPPPAAPPRIAGFLTPEIAQGLVSVRETAERCVITVRGDGMFGSGSAEVRDTVSPLLARIGEALNTLPGKVVVIGHTDNTKPGLSARLPSNYDLSKARAAGVMTALAGRAGPVSRYTAEGRGDTEPLVANDSPINRARNRRVDIVVLTPAPAP